MRDRIVLLILVAGAIAISLGVIPVVPALALTGTEMQITTNTSDQIDPAISGSYIVFTDGRNGKKEIFLYDISSGREVSLTPGCPTDFYLNDVDGNRVVYTTVTATGSRIDLYDVTTSSSTPLSSGGSNYLPAVEGDHVVFVNATATARNIMLVDIAAWTVKTISLDPPDAYAPRVDGDWVVWEELVGSWRQIKAYRISAGKIRTLTFNEANQCRPDISGNLVVWADDRNGNWDIYGYDLDMGVTTQLTFDSSDQQYPRISGRRVVWEDGRGDVTQIWTMDLDEGLEEPVSPSTHAEFLNAIDGNRIVWTEGRYGNFDIFMFTVKENHAPELTIGPQEIDEGDTLSLLVTATDPDGDPLLYSAENLPEGAVFDTNRMFTWTPGYDQAGVYTVTFSVTDGELSDIEEVTITVHNINQAPELTIGPQEINEGDTLSLLVTATDPDGDPLLYSAMNLPEGAVFDTNRMFTWTPGYDQAGVYPVTFSVTDGELSDSEEVPITVHNVNQAPELTIGPQEIDEVDTLSILVTATDPDGDPLLYSAMNLPEGAVFDTNRMFTWTPGYDQAGVYTVTFSVTDGELSDSEEVTITVHNVNRIPVADAGSDQLLQVIGQQVVLCGDQSYDEDGEILANQWTLVTKPFDSTAALDDATSVCTSFIADVQGTYVAQLVVRDPYSESLPDYVTVSFENIPPVANAGSSQSIQLGDTALLDGSGSFDLNGDPLAYTWSLTSAPPGSVSPIVNPDSVYPFITPDTIGTYTIQLVVNDGIIDSDPSSIQVEVVAGGSTIIKDLQALQNAINALDPSVFKNPNMQNALINKINAIISDVEKGDYQDAVLKLQHDILPKTDGCALTGAPDNNDWIRDCEAQAIIYPMVLSIIEEL